MPNNRIESVNSEAEVISYTWYWTQPFLNQQPR